MRFPDDAVANSALGGCSGAMAGGPFNVAYHPGLPSISERPQPCTDPAPARTDDEIRTCVRQLTTKV
jgi:hypothetical protein